MGNDYMIWDRPGDDRTESNDWITWKFLRDQGTKVPLIKDMVQFGEKGDQHQFTVMSRAKGVSLENVWAELTQKEKTWLC